MIFYRVRPWAHGRKVFTTSLNRKVSKHGYFSYLSKFELLTLAQVRKCCLSGKANSDMFEPIEINKRLTVVHEATDRRYYFNSQV